MRFLILYLLFGLLICETTHAQKDLKTAEKAFKFGDYYTAVEFYESAFKDKKFEKNQSKAIDAYFHYADACRYSYNFSKAEEYYKKVVESEDGKSKYPSADFYYAYTLKHNAKYDEALMGFNEFLASSSDSKDLKSLRDQSKQEVIACELAKDLYKRPVKGVEVENVGDNVNTKYSDFAPHLVDGDLYYSSLKFEAQTKRRVDSEDPVKKHLYGKLMVAREGGKKRGALLGNLNQKYLNVGNSTLSPDGKNLYYTVCEKDVNYEFECKIFVAKRSGRNFGKGEELPFNTKTGTSTHPAVGFDSTDNKMYLFFSSNRDGGQGKMDIWAVEIMRDDKYGDPFNLGPVINTEGNEATPFYHNTSQLLYFSSTWHPGLGGYDIFKSEKSGNTWSEPYNVGVPLNSAANDLYFYISPQVDTFGFFSSNRPGSKVLTGESCCNDIYALVLPTVIEPGDPIDLIASNKPDPIKEPEPVVEPEPIPEPIVVPEPEPIVEPEPSPEPIVEPEPTPEPIIVPEPEPIVEPEPVTEPTVEALEEMLPLTLYFHNDEPDQDTWSTTTKKSYSETYVSYFALKTEYKTEYATQYNGVEEKGKAEEKVEGFFKNKVQLEFERMNEFLDQVGALLEKGEALELHVRGFCSPRAATNYNVNLAKRRIVCMKNQIRKHNGGDLKNYLESGKLRILELPIGESQAPRSVSDDYNDPQNSIYSPEASQERKVHIEAIRKQVN